MSACRPWTKPSPDDHKPVLSGQAGIEFLRWCSASGLVAEDDRHESPLESGYPNGARCSPPALKRFHDYRVRSGLSEVELFLVKSPV